MANINVCDICGEKCESFGRYELIYRCFLSNRKQDICFECMRKMQEIINKSKIKLSMTTDKIKLKNIMKITTKQEVYSQYNNTKVDYSNSKISICSKLKIADINGILFMNEYVVSIQEDYYGFEVITINYIWSFKYCDNNWEEIK